MTDSLHFYPDGGMVEPHQWVALGKAARAGADGNVYLEQHSVISVRGVYDAEAFADIELPDSPGDTPTTHRFEEPPIGWLTQHTEPGRVDLGAGLHRGVLPGEHAELIGQLGAAISVTEWRGVVIHDLAEGDADVVLRVLAPRGFIFDANSAFLND